MTDSFWKKKMEELKMKKKDNMAAILAMSWLLFIIVPLAIVHVVANII
jgi:hypothetical protein